MAVGGLTRGTGLTTTGSGAQNAWGANGWDGNASAAAAISANDFVTFSVTADPGFNVSFSSVSAYNIRRSNNGPTTGQWQYQVGAGSFVDIGSEITWGATINASGNAQTAIDLSGITALQSVAPGTTVTFRIANYNASSNAGTWYLNDPSDSPGNDFIVNGTTSLIPEPTTAALALGLGGLAMARRRRTA